MLQRNITPYSLIIPTLNPPQEIEPGGEIEHDAPLAGFEPVVKAPPTPNPAKSIKSDKSAGE